MTEIRNKIKEMLMEDYGFLDDGAESITNDVLKILNNESEELK